MAAFEIRPRRATELVDASFQLLRRFYPQLVTVSAIAMTPSVFMRIIWRKELSDPTALMTNRGLAFGAIVLSALCVAIADAVLITAASDGYLEGRIDLSRSVGLSVSRLGSVLVASVLRYFAIGAVAAVLGVIAALVSVVHAGVLLLIIIPLAIWLTIWVALRTFAVVSAVMLEGRGPIGALDRSWQLSKNCAAHIFFSLGLTWTLYLVVVFVATGVGAVVLSTSLAGILSAILIIPIYPLLAVVSTLLYYDLRIRKEGFDLEVMSRELGTAPEPLPAA